MAKVQKPVCRVCRKANEKLYLKGQRCVSAKCPVDPRRHKTAPRLQRFRKTSEYGLQLREKNKVKAFYGVLERQFRRYYAEADQRKGSTGENLLKLLESRLDCVVHRMGFAASRTEARQLVRHNGITVNGRKLNIPSFQVRPNDVVAVSERARQQLRIQAAMQMAQQRGFPEWVDVDPKELKGVFKNVPDRSDLPSEINEHLVVELYSK